MRRTMRIVVAWALILTVVCQGQTTWWVDATASGPGSGSSSSPFVSIAAGIAAASPGDRVNVGPGMGPSALLGLCLPGPADIQLALTQVTAPLGTTPFHFTAGANSMTFGPYSAAPLTVEGVCFQLSNSGVIEAASRVTRYSIQ